VKVRYGEGVANHIGPEPCIAGRKAGGEASAGERIGQPLSRVRIIPGADAVPMAEGNMPSTLTRVLVQPGVVRDPGMCRRSLCGNREIPRPTSGGHAALVRIGKARSRSR
jgi:hypothetical protein